MFRWVLILRKLFTSSLCRRLVKRLSFAFPRKRPKARHPRPTVKLELEVLTERIVLSASLPAMPVASPPVTPPIEVVMSRTVSTVDQWAQAMATARYDLNNVCKMIAQEIILEVASTQQQWEQLLGIVPNVYAPPLNNAMPQGGSGSGSGAAATAHNAQNPQLPIAAPQAGSGSGSGATTTARDNTSAQGIKMAALPAGSGSGSGGNVYTWDPGAGNGAGSGSSGGTINYLSSNYKNWLLNGAPQKGATGTVPSKPTDDVVFDGSAPYLNQPIEWVDPKLNTMTLKNGYNALQTIDSGAVIELTGQVGGSSLSMDANSWLKLHFTDGTSKFLIDANATITNMVLGGNQNGLFQINGGTTRIGGASTYQTTIGVIFTIGAGATVNDQSNGSIKFGNNNLAINVYGTMLTFYAGQTLIDNAGYANDYINVSGGTMSYAGKKGVTDTFTVPVFVQKGGIFQVLNGQDQPLGGTLVVKDASNYIFPNKSKCSVYMADASSLVQLSQNATLQCDDDYYQANGLLVTKDAKTCVLKDGPQGVGTATIAGGTVQVDDVQNTYGELDVIAANLNFGGKLAVSILGYANPKQNQGQQDVLAVVGGNFNLNPQAATLLFVSVYGTAVGGDTWTIIDSKNITSNNPKKLDFASMDTNPETNLNSTVNPPGDQGQYQLSF